VGYKHARLGVVSLKRDLEMVYTKLKELSPQFPFAQVSKLIAGESFRICDAPKVWLPALGC
jgi:hypothetical protein